MSEHNFNSFKNFEVPNTWVKKAQNVPPQKQENNIIPFKKTLWVVACFALVIALSVCIFAFNNSEKHVTTNSEETKASEKNTDNAPDLSPAKSNMFEVPQNITPSYKPDSNDPTTANNICVGEFSASIAVGEGNIYCVLYDYKTGELMGDENLLATEHRAKIEDLGNGMVKATYNPVEKGVVKKSGEYWYVFYNELIMSPVQNYIYIYN
ncbi:MAG: hypothetical protein IJ433_06430 [Ruminococcus sp.]|nr:hypothetical protein [Ruminococcus sp.]